MLLTEDQVAIVTGGSRGIGKGIARALSAEGARVVVAGVDEVRARETAAEIQAESGCATLGLSLDVRSEASIELGLRACLDRFGVPTILVNNAGVYLNSPLLETSRDEWEQVFAVNVTGTFLATRAVGRLMARQGRGRIVNISSCSARKADPGQAAYNASKSAIVGLTRVTALELGTSGITCNAVLPGAVLTDMTRTSLLNSPDLEHQWKARTALGRLGRPEDVASAVLFLVSRLGDHVTGESIVVSAGELMSQ